MALIVMSMVEGHNLTCLWLLALAYYISGLYGFGPPHVVNGPEAISVLFIWPITEEYSNNLYGQVKQVRVSWMRFIWIKLLNQKNGTEKLMISLVLGPQVYFAGASLCCPFCPEIKQGCSSGRAKHAACPYELYSVIWAKQFVCLF